MTNNKILVAAMSGGVDSSVAASFFIEQGYKVIGVTLKMKNCDNTKEKTKSCCGIDDNIQVKLVAEKLKIQHRFIPVREEFEDKILRYAWNEYKTGRTPNPCVLCNRYVKFGDEVIRFAREMGASGIITGHYAIINRELPNKARLFKGSNAEKDQTYFLSGLTQDQLNLCYMPLGNLDKKEVRAIAEKIGLPNFAKKDSQDACFGYKGETFAMTLSRYFNESLQQGEIVDEDNNVIGTHNGLQFFTIGQRKKLGIALGKPAYVIDIDKGSNRIKVSTDQEKLLCEGFYASNMSWLDFEEETMECEVQTRYRQPLQPALVTKKGNKAVVDLKSPLSSVTPGQRLAIFKNSQLLGGGWIEKP
ncbi:MAG: tRNA 2-thiouridine(34) synthase MnmA [Candidatus Riflebacteria bacterium]